MKVRSLKQQIKKDANLQAVQILATWVPAAEPQNCHFFPSQGAGVRDWAEDRRCWVLLSYTKSFSHTRLAKSQAPGRATRHPKVKQHLSKCGGGKQ